MDFIKRIYRSKSNMTEQDFERGRKLFVVEGSISTTIANLSMGAFLAGYIQYLGGSQEFSGIVLTIPMWSSIIQIFTPGIYERLVSRKIFIAILAPLHRVMLGMMAFIPLIFNDTSTRLTVLFVLYTVSFLLLQMTNPAALNWIMSLVPENIRGRYYGRRDSYMLATSTIFSISAGFLLDYFKKFNSGDGFMIMYFVVLLLGISNFYFLGKIKEPTVNIRYYKHAETGEKIPAGANFKQILIVPFLDEKFRKVLLLSSIWTASIMIAIAYFPIYQVTELKLSYSYITLCLMLQMTTMIVFARIWGRFADKHSWFKTLRICVLLLSGLHVVWFFTFQSTVFMIPLFYIWGGICWSGINMSFFNIPYKYSPDKGKTIFISLFSSLMGVISLGASLIGTGFVQLIGKSTFDIFGLKFTSMQFLFLISGIMMVCVGMYIKNNVEKNQLFKVDVTL